MNGKLKVVSLFSGGLGLDLGLESTGFFDILACVEKEKPFCDTIRINQSLHHISNNLRTYHVDITQLDAENLLNDLSLKPGELDLLVGGPPCQSFSTAGRRGTIQDPRGTLIWDFMRFIKVLKPKFFLMENVRGLLSAAIRHRPIAERPEKGGPPLLPDEEPGSVVRLFAEDIKNIEGNNYHMDVFEVNAVNYGAPQIRERVLFIGNRLNLKIDFPNPSHVSESEIQPEPDLFNNVTSQSTWRTLKDAIGDLYEESPEIMDFSPRKKDFLKLVPPGSNWRSLPVDIQKESMGKAWYAKGGRSGWWRRLTYDLPSPTLITMPNHASTSLCHPIETRALSVREYARIQEFPDHWVFSGSTSQKYAQIGNAVPLRLGKIAGEVIFEAHQNAKGSSSQKIDNNSNYRIIYVKAHIRTRQWYKNGKVKVWNDGKNNKRIEYGSMKTQRKRKII